MKAIAENNITQRFTSAGWLALPSDRLFAKSRCPRTFPRANQSLEKCEFRV